MAAVILQSAYKPFNNLVQYRPYIVNGGLEVSYPQVLYSGVVYEYRAYGTAVTPATNPITYKNPNVDASATALYTLGGGGSTNVLGTALTGFVPTSGVTTATSTVLQAFNNLSFKSYGYIQGISGTVTTGLVSLTGAVNKLTSDITVTNPNINIPNGKTFLIKAYLYVTTAATSGATFTITGTNSTVQSQAIPIGASQTTALVLVNAWVQVTAASAIVALTAESVTGTVTLNNQSTLILTQLN